MKKILIAVLLLVCGVTSSVSAQSLYPDQFRFQGYVATSEGTESVGTSYVALTYTTQKLSLKIFDREHSHFEGAIMHRERGFCSDYYASDDPMTMGWMLQRFILSGGLSRGSDDEIPMVFEVDVIYQDSVSMESGESPVMVILTAGGYELRTMTFIARETTQQ